MPKKSTTKRKLKKKPQGSSHHKHALPLIEAEGFQVFQDMVNSIGDDLVLLRRDAQIMYANDAAVKSYGYSRKYVLSRKITHFLKNKISVKVFQDQIFNRVKASRAPVRMMVERVVKGGRVRAVDVTAVYLPLNSHEYILALGRDITERLQMQSKLKESEMFQALNHFISGTTREILYPLKGVLHRLQSISQFLEKKDFEYIGFKEYKRIIETIDHVSQQVKYCCDTTDRLINLNRRTVGWKKNDCDANKTIRSSINLIDEQFMQPNTKIKLRLAPKLPMVAMSDVELNQVLVIVLTNAVQSMPAGGLVNIQTSYNSHKKMITIKVKDEGIGIKKEHLSHIFEPFFTTKQRGLEKSSGLGLSIMYSIVQAHKGNVAVESSLRRGTSVKIELPASHSKK